MRDVCKSNEQVSLLFSFLFFSLLASNLFRSLILEITFVVRLTHIGTVIFRFEGDL